MAESVQTGLVPATEVAREVTLQQAPNGVLYTLFGDTNTSPGDLARLVQAVPAAIAAGLTRKAYYFVPLAMSEAAPDPSTEPGPDRSSSSSRDPKREASSEASPEASPDPSREHKPEEDSAQPPAPTTEHQPQINPAGQLQMDPASQAQPNAASQPQIKPAPTSTPPPVLIARTFSPELADNAICHRNVPLGNREGVFISTRLLSDRFALAFEFFINVGHAFIDNASIPAAFADLVWAQAVADVRGETSQDAWESRALALPPASLTEPTPPPDDKARADYIDSAFSDAIAIYQLSLFVDFDYSELREREYPLLAPQSLAERLRFVARLYPPNPDYEFAIRYRRRA